MFLIYTAELFAVIDQHGFKAHSYADDTQIYLSVAANDARDAARRFADCVADVDSWMDRNRLKLNTDKTQIIWVGNRQQLAKLVENGCDLAVCRSSPFTDRG